MARLHRANIGWSSVWLLAGLLFAQQAGAWPDLKIVKSGPAQATPGDVITYTLNYTNNGPVKSTSVVMKDFLPPNVTALTNTLNGGSLSGSTISWSIGTLNSKAKGSRTFQVQLGTNFPTGESYITNRSQIFGKEAEEPGDDADNYSKFVTKIIKLNRAPVAQNDAYIMGEDTVLVIAAPGVLANDSDADGNALTAVLSSGVTNGTLTLNANGSFTYAPNTNFNGFDYFTYRANDGKTNSGIATVAICVTPTNDPPVARNDQYATQEDAPLTISAPGVLSNDTDADGDALTATIASQPGNGLVSLNANGGFTYTPDTNFNGSDSFTYRANDGTANSGIATVTITVTPLNDPPLARNDAFTVNENTALVLSAPGVLANDSDPEGDPLTAILVSGPTNGVLTFAANGSFTYKPATNYVGADAFRYRANDGLVDSGVAIVQITVLPVNEAPVARDDQYSMAEDTLLTVFAPGVLSNDSDPDNDPLSSVLVSGPTNGVFALNADGSFNYAPNTNFAGMDAFTYRASDGFSTSGVATVRITVAGTNDAPLARNDQYATPEDTVLVVGAPGVLTNDSDPEGDALTANLVASPTNGVLMLNADGSFTYTPATNFNGLDVFTYRASDGQADSGIATVTITVTGANDPPQAQDDAYTTGEDTALVIAAPGVLLNDSDIDGDTLTTVLASNPAQGTLTLNADGSFVYMPSTNFNGIDSFTYRASDGLTNSGIATVTITVVGTNDAPIARDDQYATLEDVALQVPLPGVLGNDTDPDGDALTANIATLPANGLLALNLDGSFAYTPNTNYYGTDTFTYRANDGQAVSELTTVTILVLDSRPGTNDPPIAQNDLYTTFRNTPLTIPVPGLLGNDSDPDGDLLSAVLASNPTQGTLALNPDGSFTYAPNTNFQGADSFTYRAHDGETNSNLATVTINVTRTNLPPLASNDSYTVGEDTLLVLTAPGVLGNDSDPDGDALTATLVTNTTNGVLSLNTNGGFSYLPNTNFNGLDSFTYRANDDLTNSGVATVTITVLATNDPPNPQDDDYFMDEDTVLVVSAPGVLLNDTDPEGNPITAAIATLPANGLLSFNSNGGFTYTPNTNFFGIDTITYRANDGQLDSTPATVRIHVTEIYDPPDTNNWTGKSFTTFEDVELVVPPPGVLAGILGVDGHILKAALLRRITNGTFNLELDGSFRLTPFADFNGVDAFEFEVVNGQSNNPALRVDITVFPVNDRPSFVRGVNFRLPQNAGPQIVPGWATAISPGPADESGQAVVFQVSNDNSSLFTGQPVLSPSGTLSFTPAPGASGTATVTVVARDDGGTADGGLDTSLPQTFAIVLNTPPTVQIVSPTNGAFFFMPASFTVLADAQDIDGVVTNVHFSLGTNSLAVVTNEPFFTVLTNLPLGSYTFAALAMDDLGATGLSTPVTVNVLDRPPLTHLTSVYYNPQKDFFEQRVRVSNPSGSTLDAVRVLIYNLTNTPPITVGNRTGSTNDTPYVQSSGAVPPGGYVDLTIEYLSPLRLKPNPILLTELVSPANPPPLLPGTMQHINRGLLLANRTFLLEFSTLSNRVYSVQYSGNLSDWKAAQPAIVGDGNWIQWIDNGEPKTDGSPADASARFYRLILLP